MDRDIDPRATCVPILAFFDTAAMKGPGLPVKLAMFDIAAPPDDAVCIYVDLDSVIIGNLDPLAQLTDSAPIWTIDVFPRRFSAIYRMLWRFSGKRSCRVGNSSVLAYRNRFEGNPTKGFQAQVTQAALPKDMYHDDKFHAWWCQDVIHGFSPNRVAYFRIEFLAPAMWISTLFSLFRRRGRAQIAVITFAGPETKVSQFLDAPDTHIIRDHHGRVGYWSDAQTNGIKSRVRAELAAAPSR